MRQRLLLIVLSIVGIYQSSSGQSWIRYYGDGLDATTWNVTALDDKGYLFCACVGNLKYSWLFKTDINGYILWGKKFGDGTYSSSIGNAEQTFDGGFIFCGSTTKYSGDNDAYIIKLNACAEVEWCRVLETPDDYDMGLKIKQTPEGDFVLLGSYFATSPTSNVSLFKFDGIGNLIWHQFYAQDSAYNDDQPRDLLVDNEGYLVVSSRYDPDPGTTSPAIARHYFVKTDFAGNKIWELVYGKQDYYYGWPWVLTRSPQGSYYEAGNHFFANGNGNPSFVKVLNNGTQSYKSDILFGSIWGGTSSIDFLHDTNLVMVGGWYSDLNTKHDAFFKTDTLGNLIKLKEVQSSTNSYESACKSFDNKFLAVGNDAPNGHFRIVAVKVNSDLEYDSIYTQTFNYDSLCPHQILSDTTDPECSNVFVNVDEPFKVPETCQMKIYPNPANNKVFIELPKYLKLKNNTKITPTYIVYYQWQSVILQILDLDGRIILENELLNKTIPEELDISNLKPDMYLFRLLYKNQDVSSVKVIVK